jgi:SAM-dependent methyltransferase
MRYAAIERRLPPFLRRHLLHFEHLIEEAVVNFAASQPAGSRVLDAGAGETRHAAHFQRQRYVGVDLAVGDPQWNYGKLDAIADLSQLPFRADTFDACINIVTLEHVTNPAAVVSELARALRPGGRLLVIVPHEWEVHQSPHDYFRYTRHGMQKLLEQAGLADIQISPAGGFFRLLARRSLNALQFFPGVWFIPAAMLFIPPALILPWLDGLDRTRDFTLGYVCTARKC